MNFSFSGTVPCSKSILNRLLIVQSFSPAFQIGGSSLCDDVTAMKRGIAALLQREPINCGDGAAVLRFLAIRASRIPGVHIFTGSRRLMSRPHSELVQLLNQFGIETIINDNKIIIKSNGWHKPESPLIVDRSYSSQFASGVLLASWNLPWPLTIASPNTNTVSDGYWDMTIKLMRELGMQITGEETLLIPQDQHMSRHKFICEIDLSSAFVLGALATLAGQATITQFPKKSLQPDSGFVEILQRMGATVKQIPANDYITLIIHKAEKLLPINVDLCHCPDLFPVLCVLAAFADGKSHICGAPHLIHKESNRLLKTSELLTKIGVPNHMHNHGLVITGNSHLQNSNDKIEFCVDHDHRLAMATALLMIKDFKIQLDNREVVNKSFPGFWQLLEQS